MGHHWIDTMVEALLDLMFGESYQALEGEQKEKELVKSLIS